MENENMKLYVRNVVLPNICKMLFVIGYIVLMYMWIFPQMDILNNKTDAFSIMISVLFGLYGLCTPVYNIISAYIDMKDRERKHYLYIKNEFALFNEHYWAPDWNLRDLQYILKETKRLGIDKELPTDRDCRIYLYGHDPEENRPPRPKLNSQHTMIEVDGKWHDIPDKFYGKLMDEATIDQIMRELKIS